MTTALGRLEDLPADYVAAMRALNLVPLWPSSCALWRRCNSAALGVCRLPYYLRRALIARRPQPGLGLETMLRPPAYGATAT